MSGGSNGGTNGSDWYDVFICHAHGDADVADTLGAALKSRGLTVWLDKQVLKIGDGLLAKINQGLAHSTFGVVVLSPSFFGRKWPEHELNGLQVIEQATGRVVVLPVWHEVDYDDVFRYSPSLAGKLSSKTAEGMDAVVRDICRWFPDCPGPDGDEPAAARPSPPPPPPIVEAERPPLVPASAPPPPPPPPPPPSWWRAAAVLLVVDLVLLVGGGLAVLKTVASSHYVGKDLDVVAVFQGPPEGLLWVEPKLVERKEGLSIYDLCPAQRSEVSKGIRTGSKSAADDYVDELRRTDSSQC